jgi:hypothetical protein
MLNGIGGGIGTGLAYFLFTSKVKKACNIGVLSFGGITLSYWQVYEMCICNSLSFSNELLNK